MNKISFVILHYRNTEATNLCIRSILGMEHQEQIQIVVVDNDIYADEEERLNTKYELITAPNVTIIPVNENGGFSHGNNKGYSYAKMKQKADIVVVANDDIQFLQRDFILRLERIAQKEVCDVLGPDVIRQSTKEHQNPMADRGRTKEEVEYTIRMNRRGLMIYPILYPILRFQQKRAEKRTFREKIDRKEYYKKRQEGIVPFGACLIFMPGFVHREEKAFEPETHFFYEEYLLFERCKKKRYKTLYHPGLKVLHEGGKTTEKIQKNEYRRIRFQMKQILASAEIYLKTCLSEENTNEI